MQVDELLFQLLEQNKTKIFRVDFLPTEDMLIGNQPTKLIGIKRKTGEYVGETVVYNFKDKQEYTFNTTHITQLNLRKFQLEV